MTYSSTSSSEPSPAADDIAAAAPGSRYDDSTVAVTIGLILCAVVAVLRSDVATARNPDWYWMMKVDRRELAATVIGGDSRVYRGIDPTAIEERLGGGAFNAGFSSAKFNRDYLEYLRRIVSPTGGTILLGISPFSFGAQSATGFESAREQNDRRRLPITFLRTQESIPELLTPFDLHSCLGLDAPAPTNAEYQQRFHDSGWVESDQADGITLETWKERVSNASRGHPTDPSMIEDFLDVVSMWRSEGIEVLAFVTPVRDEVLEYELDLFHLDLEQLKRDFEAAGGAWIEVATPIDLRWYDVSHLDGRSARAFSTRLAEAVDRQLTGKHGDRP